MVSNECHSCTLGKHHHELFVRFVQVSHRLKFRMELFSSGCTTFCNIRGRERHPASPAITEVSPILISLADELAKTHYPTEQFMPFGYQAFSIGFFVPPNVHFHWT